jgi:hypothetical protein
MKVGDIVESAVWLYSTGKDMEFYAAPEDVGVVVSIDTSQGTVRGTPSVFWFKTQKECDVPRPKTKLFPLRREGFVNLSNDKEWP